jgi:hypothetical protein
MYDETYEAEELILSMAYIVREKRRLEEENLKLKDDLKWHEARLNERFIAAQNNGALLLKAALVGAGYNPDEVIT